MQWLSRVLGCLSAFWVGLSRTTCFGTAAQSKILPIHFDRRVNLHFLIPWTRAQRNSSFKTSTRSRKEGSGSLPAYLCSSPPRLLSFTCGHLQVTTSLTVCPAVSDSQGMRSTHALSL
ncbi:hypothetical protein F4859DRAFT_102205 [Xylaria cf. heliscus]|nr:hypothetical protein F4859DRAFT_102205 [Xylaria cf. heliscus]